MSPVQTRQVGYVTEYQGSDGNWYRLNPPGAKTRREGESVDAARTRKNNELLAAGRHPATRLLLLNADPPCSCGECSHLRVKDWRTNTKGTRRWYGCELHRLGLSSLLELIGHAVAELPQHDTRVTPNRGRPKQGQRKPRRDHRDTREKAPDPKA